MELKSTIRAYAKVNWHLAVGCKKEDGYHPISSLFQLCSLYDELEISISEGPFEIEVLGLEGLCEKGCSTVDKAAVLWHQETGFDKKITVKITKNIPSQAGLGGGSSDAASLLFYLNSIDDQPMSIEKLMQMGAKVGCDVPFFVSQAKAAYVMGLGEIVMPIKAKPLKGFIIVSDSEKVSTKQAYQALDTRTVIPELDTKEELLKEYEKPYKDWSFRNDFDMVNTRPQIQIGEGEKLMLTGSGSCYVLLTERVNIKIEGSRAIEVCFLAD